MLARISPEFPLRSFVVSVSRLVDAHPLLWLEYPTTYLRIGVDIQSFLQELVLNALTLATLDCFATADVLVGGSSQFTEAAAALSTNVKVLSRQGNQEPYRMTLNWLQVVANDYTVQAEIQAEIDAGVRSWWNCHSVYKKVVANGQQIHRVYETVDFITSL